MPFNEYHIVGITASCLLRLAHGIVPPLLFSILDVYLGYQ